MALLPKDTKWTKESDNGNIKDNNSNEKKKGGSLGFRDDFEPEELLKNIMSYEELKALTTKERKRVLKDYLKHYSNLELIFVFDIRKATFFSAVKDLGLESSTVKPPKELRGIGNKITQKEILEKYGFREPEGEVSMEKYSPKVEVLPSENNENYFETLAQGIVQKAITEYQNKLKELVKVDPDGFSISLNGVYTSKEIESKFTKLGLLLDGEDNKRFKIKLSIEEVLCDDRESGDNGTTNSRGEKLIQGIPTE